MNKFYNIKQSFVYAFRGILFCIRHEKNMRIHICVTFYVMFFSLFYDFSRVEYALLLIVCTIVLSLEMINTAIEVVIDKVSPQYSALAKIGKDVAAGAVFISAGVAVVIGLVMFWDYEKMALILTFLTEDLNNLDADRLFDDCDNLYRFGQEKKYKRKSEIMTKSVFAAIVGRANAGKSSLTNLLVGEKIAIVSEKPQTTRIRINGILTKGETQFVFIDTPGMHKAHNKLSQAMVKTIRTSIEDINVAVLMADCTRKISATETDFIKSFNERGIPVVLVLNKVDLLKDRAEVLKVIATYSEMGEIAEIIPVSVKNKENTDAIIPVLEKYAVESPHYFSDDMPTDQPEKIWLSEIVREKLLNSLYEEIPHGIAVEIESMEFAKTNSGKDIVDLGVVIICEKQSHKGMIIGKQGAMLKKIGSVARAEMEEYFESKVNMKIWVKVKEDWRNRESVIADLGLDTEE